MITPSASVLNAGRTSQHEQIYLEGTTDIDASVMEFQVWSGGANITDDSSSQTMRIADGAASQLTPDGEWQALSGASQTIAPGGDLLTYLVSPTRRC